ncbi:DUF6928 family protein [Nonomuraea gerenzanensis]|uniref:Uncharacterized protein n=1 Tax=Nonomuraea gerenzanensis TaxID=93944 RepID=A0A1M4E8F8_9ACTN|nr:hypothetical protein [Nonomuraea gerenzanensis]UBU17284.1 hypothetical protein LCN96_20350 [Nonomuraea gerenzanensis]SBO95028.1 hypothetical protein BN4615_P4544 [Nonomuraea gerenzanensis]
MGAKTGVIAYSSPGNPLPRLLRTPGRPDETATRALIERSFPGWHITQAEPGNLLDHIRPPEDLAYATSFPGVDLVCCDHFMIDNPSQLPAHLIEAGRGRRLVLHAMHSVVDWLAFAVWEDGRLIRSLSLSPDSGVIENLGDPFPFELPYWNGEHPVLPTPGRPDEGPYPLPFHPLELGEDALRELLGFTIEGSIEPDDAEPEDVELLGFTVIDPDGPAPEERRAQTEELTAQMGEPRIFRYQPDGSVKEVTWDDLG